MAADVIIRPAGPADAPAMADLLNAIIARGGTTAHRTPFSAERMVAHYVAPPRAISCMVAEADGRILGFQPLEWCDPDWTGPHPLPADWAVIATFVAIGTQGQGIGARLFAATRQSAKKAGVKAIDATIRRENAGGLAFYSRMGFQDSWSDATVVAKLRAP
ncbi:GNAT family N-acetyltransferase [Phreatobacter sp.]|uniref:GNAT family N-acetyltransferase n=1 Tax=Phreatobacter sp. TaxID=1966341 RepID=UPI003F6EB4FB